MANHAIKIWSRKTVPPDVVPVRDRFETPDNFSVEWIVFVPDAMREDPALRRLLRELGPTPETQRENAAEIIGHQLVVANAIDVVRGDGGDYIVLSNC